MIELLVNLLCHDVWPVDHAGAEVEINGTRTASLVDDRHHRIVVVQSNFADVRFVGEQQRSMAFHSSRKCIGFYVYYLSILVKILQKQLYMYYTYSVLHTNPFSAEGRIMQLLYEGNKMMNYIPASGGVVGILDVSAKTLTFEAALVIDAKLRTSPRNIALINI